MNRTIVIFTRGNKMVDVHGDLDDAQVMQRISPLAPFFSEGEAQLYLLLDMDVPGSRRTAHIEWEQFTSVHRTGALHFVHHEQPMQESRVQFQASLSTTSPGLLFGPGFNGRHERNEQDVTMPYRQVAKLLIDAPGTDKAALFEELWNFLEEHDPIEDLLADQLDYLHGLLSGQRIAAGAALKKAIPDGDLSQLISGLPAGAPTKEYHTAFEEIRDKILDLRLPEPEAP